MRDMAALPHSELQRRWETLIASDEVRLYLRDFGGKDRKESKGIRPARGFVETVMRQLACKRDLPAEVGRKSLDRRI